MRVNMIVWWAVIMFGSWIVAAVVLWGTNLVIPDKEGEETENDGEVRE